MLQWNEVLVTIDSQTNTVTNEYLQYEISRIVVLNGQLMDWGANGITHTKDADEGNGVLDFSAIGGVSGRLIFYYKSSGVAGTGVTNQTNHYDIDSVLPYLRGRLGWRNPTTDGYSIVDSGNQQSASGRYYNDNSFHPFCQIEYLYDCQPDKGQSSAEFNTYLGQLGDSAITSAINYVFDQPQYIESGQLYDKIERTELRTIANSGQFVGVRFRLSKSDYYLNLINAMLYFDSNVTFTLYLYNEFRGKVAEWEVSAQANKQVIVNISEALRYSDASSKGGMWFLGYFQDDLGDAKAISYSACWQDTKRFGAWSFSSAVTGVETFNMQQYTETYDTFGLNVEYSVTEDITQLIRRNSYLLDNLQGLIMAAMVIDICINSPRSNRNKRIGDETLNMMFRELNNVTMENNPTEPGLKSKIRKEIAKVKKAFVDKPKTQVVSLR